MEKVLRLHSTCRLVSGISHSAIYDLERRRLYRFPSRFVGLFEPFVRGCGAIAAEARFPDAIEDARLVVGFIVDHELGAFLDAVDASCFVDVDTGLAEPAIVTSSIVDIEDRVPDWPVLAEQLNALGCKSLQIRCYSDLLDPATLIKTLLYFNSTTVTRLSVVTKWTQEWNDAIWPHLFDRYVNLQSITLHSSPSEALITGLEVSRIGDRRVRLRKEAVLSEQQCGSIVEGSLNLPTSKLFSVLKNENGCLGRKVSIDRRGRICACPSMEHRYGNDMRRLSEVAKSENFQLAWKLKKDDISICSACEYRYVCTDCRAYLGSELSTLKPARCEYDPSSGQWSNARNSISHQSDHGWTTSSLID